MRPSTRLRAAGAILISAVMFAALAAPAASPGQEAFEKRCGGCHSADQAKEGPPLRGVFNRAAGQVAGFPYSAGLKASGIKWTGANLDRWLIDPSAVVPDTDMAFRLNDAAERERIVGYLKELR